MSINICLLKNITSKRFKPNLTPITVANNYAPNSKKVKIIPPLAFGFEKITPCPNPSQAVNNNGIKNIIP